MKSIWNGTIRFGLVHIPVKLFSATRSQEVHFHYLHETDLGRVKNERVCTKCKQVVDANELVREYEYEKGKYLPLAEEDVDNVDVELRDSVPILAFVDPHEIAPIFFDKPYYLVPDKKVTRNTPYCVRRSNGRTKLASPSWRFMNENTW